MSTFCLPDIRNTTNYEILCGRITTGETMNSFVQSPGGSWILSLRRFLTNSTFTCVKNSDCAAKRQVRATQCLIQVCVIHWMKCLAPIGCFSLSVIHHPLLLSAPFRVRHSGSCDFVLTYPCFFLHYIHEPPLRPSSFPPPWQLQRLKQTTSNWTPNQESSPVVIQKSIFLVLFYEHARLTIMC